MSIHIPHIFTFQVLSILKDSPWEIARASGTIIRFMIAATDIECQVSLVVSRHSFRSYMYAGAPKDEKEQDKITPSGS